MRKRSLDPLAVKALALDLDGTVLNPGKALSERTLKALRGCRERGLELLMVTGRAVEAAEKYRAAMDARGPMVYFNGAVVADMPGGAVLSATLLDMEAVKFCVGLSRSMGVYYQVFLPGSLQEPRQRLIAERWCAEAEMYLDHTGIRAEICDIGEAIAAPGLKGCIKSMFLAEAEAQDRIRARLTERFGGSLYVARTLRNFLEIMNPRVSKGAGLRIALDRRGLMPGEAIAFGDEESDLPMFVAAGFSAAPANAREAVRQAADLIVPSNAEDGVAAFLEETFLR
ncbi:MAG: Cof-type HAD-IIB family hydrolase [Treponema sp.]|jgi:Cof subfamily protein (haloacid dehalogenase superfamily)|nr:Cof-type HAD-IIB family hydrolase [Treponema sp.]